VREFEMRRLTFANYWERMQITLYFSARFQPSHARTHSDHMQVAVRGYFDLVMKLVEYSAPGVAGFTSLERLRAALILLFGSRPGFSLAFPAGIEPRLLADCVRIAVLPTLARRVPTDCDGWA
jgi:hypothetical protein